MKKIFLGILICISISTYAQLDRRMKNLRNYDLKPIHFGFTIGFNTMDFVIRNSDDFYDLTEIYSIECESSPGFHLGPVSNLRLGKYFDLRLLIDLSFGQRTLNYTVAESDSSSSKYPFYSHTMDIESIFIEVPLLLKYKAKRIANYRPYVIAGINPKLDMSAKKEIKDEEMPKLRLKNKDLYYEVGAGMDFYLPYFKFAIEAKMSFGMNNIVEPIEDAEYTQYTDAIKYMNSRTFMISLHFE